MSLTQASYCTGLRTSESSFPATCPSGASDQDLVELEKVDATRGMRRYYTVWLRSDLFAQICLVRQWGRIGNRGGQMRAEPYASIETARSAMDRLIAAKRRKGYQRFDRAQ